MSKMSWDKYQAGYPGTTAKALVTKILETKNVRDESTSGRTLMSKMSAKQETPEPP